MHTLLLTSILACGNKEQEEDSGLIHISNDGPTGDAYSTPSCGPADGPAIYFAIGLESGDECQSALDEDFGVTISLWENSTIESDVPVSLTTGWAQFHYGEGEPRSAVDGEITVTFDGEWSAETEFTGYYWMELSDGLIIEGGFNGTNCDAELICG